MSDREEQELLEASRRGQRGTSARGAALQRLVDAPYDPLYRFLWRLTGSPEAAAELTQAGEPRFGAERQRRGPGPGFVRAMERLHSFRGAARFSTWFHSVALKPVRYRTAGAHRRQRAEDGAVRDIAPQVFQQQPVRLFREIGVPPQRGCEEVLLDAFLGIELFQVGRHATRYGSSSSTTATGPGSPAACRSPAR